MEFIEYNDYYQDLLATMLSDFSIQHLELLKRPYQKEQILLEAYDEIQQYKNERYKIYLGKVNDTLIGYIILDYRSKQICWIENLYVLENQRHKGYGSQMLLKAKDQVQKEGFEGLSIDVVPRNIEAIRLYLKLGFDSLSMMTLRQDFKQSYRDQKTDILGFTFRY
ncbi:GNAT family N-acetyltransferase [Beduini massiliensis]|uniref:GNAT family N-acetyltransferase n=1 Tax=Beduini massiliensis TaxID=1585974 RepID=UPI00059AA6A4|nr:GNAT family N-acetyltransferase [Beduini massiliensis]